MDLRISLNHHEIRLNLTSLAGLGVFTWLLFTYGGGALDAFIAGLTGQPPL